MSDRPLTDFERDIIQFAGSPHVGDLLERMKGHYMDEWAATKPDEGARREQLYSMVSAIDRLVAEIRSVAKNRDVERFNRRSLRPIQL